MIRAIAKHIIGTTAKLKKAMIDQTTPAYMQKRELFSCYLVADYLVAELQ
jgi:hypothetical protein